MITFFAYIEHQNFTRIHKEEIILQVLILFQENILLLSETEYNLTGTKSIHVVVSINYGY